MSGLDLNAATLAVLTEMGWPDDREASAHVEPDGYCVTPPGAYWDVAQGIAEAVRKAAAPLIEAETRRKVAEEIRAKLDIDLRSTPWVEGYWFARDAAVAIARGNNAAVARGGNEQTHQSESEETKP